MPVEAATYIHDLNPADPTHTDGLNQSDAHARLIKTVLQSTFPNLTAAVTGTPDQLNRSATGRANAGTVEVEPNGTLSGGQVKLDPVSGSGAVQLQNTGTAGNDGALAVVINDRTNANPVTAMTVSKAGAVNATASVNAPVILQAGNALIPRGVIVEWSGAANAIPGGWALCDGTQGTPDLRNVFIIGAGSTYAVGQTGGATAVATITDAQGNHAHTTVTAASPPLAMSGSSDAQGYHAHTGATAGAALDISMMPPHDHGIASGSGVVVYNGGTRNIGVTAGSTEGTVAFAAQGSGAAHAHGIYADGLHAHNIAVSNVPAHQHGIVYDGNHAHNVSVATMPPYYALCKIMKL